MYRDSERLILMEVQQCDIHNIYIDVYIYIYILLTLPEINSSHLKFDSWEMKFPFGIP